MCVTINKDIYISLFEKGIANKEFFSKKKERVSLLKNCLKIIRLFLSRLVMGHRKGLSSATVKLVWYPLHDCVLNSYIGDKVIIADHNIKLEGCSFLEYVNFWDIVIPCYSIPKCVRKSRLYYDWYFFNALYYFIKQNEIKHITIAGHYDKYATWISYLAKEMGIYLIISQHGANSRYNLPHKIPANRVETFSKAEEDMFKATILNQENTEFYIKGFNSSLTFTKGCFDGRTVAIASQPGYEEKTLMIINSLRLIDTNLNIIVYSHPSDLFRKEKMSLSIDNCRVEHKARYWNVDYLIVFTSTLAYDYWSCELFKGKVICYYDENCIVALYDDERSIVIYPKSYLNQLKEIIG